MRNILESPFANDGLHDKCERSDRIRQDEIISLCKEIDGLNAEIARLTAERDEWKKKVSHLAAENHNQRIAIDGNVIAEMTRDWRDRCLTAESERDEWERRVQRERDLFNDMKQQAVNIAAERDAAIQRAESRDADYAEMKAEFAEAVDVSLKLRARAERAERVAIRAARHGSGAYVSVDSINRVGVGRMENGGYRWWAAHDGTDADLFRALVEACGGAK